MKIKSLVFGLVIVSFTSQLWAQSAYTVRSVPLQKSPSVKSSTVAQLSKDSSLTLLQRSGGWYQVSSDAGEGWIKMLAVRLKPKVNTQQAVGTAQYRSNTTLTTGVRGLDEGGMMSGGQGISLQQIDKYLVSKEQAEVFAKQGLLASKEVDYVEE